MPKAEIERLSYKKGWQRLFYITESGEAVNPPPSVHCHSPRKTNTNLDELKLLEIGVYYFDFYFKYSGEYVFIFFEIVKGKLKPQLIRIAVIEK